MTLHILEATYRDLPCYKCVVRMTYKKDDQTRRIQKTWRAVGEVFKVKREEVESSFRAEAKRWEAQTLERLKNGGQPDLRQVEMGESAEVRHGGPDDSK